MHKLTHSSILINSPGSLVRCPAKVVRILSQNFHCADARKERQCLKKGTHTSLWGVALPPATLAPMRSDLLPREAANLRPKPQVPIVSPESPGIFYRPTMVLFFP